jgi:hypothetical protein
MVAPASLMALAAALCLEGTKVRDQLRDLIEKKYWVYCITEPDFDHAVDLVREMIDARTEQYEKEAAKVRAESPGVADDILDDVAYYRFTDSVSMAIRLVAIAGAN